MLRLDVPMLPAVQAALKAHKEAMRMNGGNE
jgi:hypothetical protein